MPRPIEHVAYYPRTAQAVRAAAALEEAGYRTAIVRWRSTDGRSPEGD